MISVWVGMEEKLSIEKLKMYSTEQEMALPDLKFANIFRACRCIGPMIDE
jgi:hypothetical protein